MDDRSESAGEPREWDAQTYQQVSNPHIDWAAQVLGRLALRGDETVLDLGIGTGRVAGELLERLPGGRVIGVDGSAAMLETARRQLHDDPRLTLIHSDLLTFAVDEPADAAVSSATFHWIADHDRLFARIRAALKPGAPFVAQCGGRGNIAAAVAVIDGLAAHPPFSEHLGGWPGPWHYADAPETEERLERAGFAVERCWLSESPVTPDAPRDFLRTVVLGAHLDRLPAELHDQFVDAVLAGLGGDRPELDYVRLNWVAAAR
jgi:trans-aconitate 2-methyltransferase